MNKNTVMESFSRWKKRVDDLALAGGVVVNTTLGQVHYTDIGEGFPVIHSHGSPTSSDSGPRAFYQVANHARVRWITPARPGFLNTPLSVGPSIEQQADMFVALMDSLNIDQAFLSSWSSGGPPAIVAAAKYPNRFKGLILYSSLSHNWEYKLSIMDRLMMKNFTNWLVDISRQKNRPAFRRKICEGAGWDYEYIKDFPDNLTVLDTFFEFMIPAKIRNDGSYNDIKQLTHLPALPFEKINIPTLVIFSPENRKIPFSNGKLAAEKIPGAKLITYEYGAHFFMADPRSAFIFDHLADFIAKTK